MSSAVEQELKWAIRPDGHPILARKLSDSLGAPVVLQQSNRFFDSPDGALRHQQASVRLRRENQRLVFTAKQHLSDSGGFHRHQEDEFLLSMALWPWATQASNDLCRVCPVPASISAHLAGKPLHCFGGFDNHRLAWTHKGEHIALDCTSFPGRTDYELEVETETPAASHAHWEQLLVDWAIPYAPQLATKLHRFVACAGL
ncbi:MAG: CYTH domain-containing protein [Planctomycetota bacterium]|jgi:uncharacterized protein YjbK|nr:CYTH domain-containing protein [Planctomycetota bacterium]